MAQKDPPMITVVGHAVVRAEPDEAVLWIRLSAVDQAAAAALTDVGERSDRLVALLDRVGIANKNRSTTGIGVDEETEYRNGQSRRVGHRATVSWSVRLVDPEQIGTLVAQAGGDLRAVIDGPHWSISAAHPARLEAAREAAAAAKRTARAYAEGVGASLGRLIGLAEPGAWGGSLAKRAMTRRGGGEIAQAAAMGPIAVESGEADVTASIEATFALER